MTTTLTKFTAAAAMALLPFFATSTSGGAQTVSPTVAACDAPNVPASTITAVQPDTPALSTVYHLNGTTYVQVDLDSTGAVLDTAVAKTSGYYALDRAALEAARQSTFQPEVRNCEPVAGSYLFVVNFPEY